MPINHGVAVSLDQMAIQVINIDAPVHQKKVRMVAIANAIDVNWPEAGCVVENIQLNHPLAFRIMPTIQIRKVQKISTATCSLLYEIMHTCI